MESLTDTNKKIISGTGGYFFANVANSVFGLAFIVLAVRILGLGDYGLLTIGITIFELAGNFGMFGLGLSSLKVLSGVLNEKNEEIIGAMFLINISIAVVLVAVLFFGSNWIAQLFFGKPLLAIVIKVIGVSLLFSLPLNLVMSILKAQKKVRLFFNVSLAKNIFKLLSLIFIFVFSDKLLGVSLTILSSSIISLGLGVYFMIKEKIYPKFKNVKKRTIEQISLGSQFLIIGLGYFLASQIDRLMLGSMKVAEEVGVFAIAASLAMTLGLVHTGMISIFMPMVSEMHKKDNLDSIGNMYYFSNMLVVFVNSLILIGFVILGNTVMKFLFNVDNPEILYIIFLMLSARYFIGTLTGPTGALLNMTGRQKIEVANTLISIVLNVILNLYMINRWGALGAALATLITILFLNIIQVIEIKKFYRIFIIKKNHWVVFLTLILLSLGFFVLGGNKLDILVIVGYYIIGTALFVTVFYFNLEKKQRRVMINLIHNLFR